jgi:hypothetical protein
MVRGRTALISFVVLCAVVFWRLGWALAPSYDVTVQDLIPLANWEKQFKITDGKDRGRLVPLIFHRGAGAPNRWRLDFGDYAGIYLTNDPAGTLMLERLELLNSRSFIVYEPVLPIFSRDIASGVAIPRQAAFKMYDRETGRLKRIGRATHTVRRVSLSQFDTPAGVIDGYYLEIDHRMDMQYAQLNISLGLGCRLDDGPVYGVGRYTLTKLGLFTETKRAAAGLAIR